MLVVFGVLALGFIKNARWVEAQIKAHQEARAQAVGAASAGGSFPPQAVLVPVDGSIKGLNAIRHLIDKRPRRRRWKFIWLLSGTPFHGISIAFLGSKAIESYLAEEAEKAFGR